MPPVQYRVRRATLDDLPALKPLWLLMRFSPDALEKCLTEFQVAEDQSGEIIGGIGFRMNGRHGCVHSESYSDFSLADIVRPLLWDRLQVLTANHGIARLWTQETSPFWSHQGFQAATAEDLKNLPEAWANEGPPWLTLKLKSEEAFVSAEKEIAMLMQAEKERTTRIFQQARMIKMLATLLALILGTFVIVAVAYMLRKHGGTLFPPR
jgi:N-acetylglutamate synthase-like GNAT family acetyltransferase